jgi:general stress protein 26
MDHHMANHGDAKILGDLLAGIEYTMLTTLAADGSLVSRPLQTLRMDADGALWFFTSASSGKIDDIRHDARVNLAYSNPAKKIFVAVSGRAEIVVDRRRIDELWSPAQTIFFPQGRDDPELALLKIVPASARYWDGKESLISTLLKFGRAVLKGEAADLGETRALDVSGNHPR